MRTIFWTLMTDSKGQRETHKSNWVWYADTSETKIKWKKKKEGMLWTEEREPLFKKGIYGTISLGEIIKAFGTLDDKKQWCKTLESIGALGLSVGLGGETKQLGGLEPSRAGIKYKDLEPSQSQPTTASSEETHQ